VGKADLSKGCWNPKRKMGMTTQFSKIKLKFAKIMQYILGHRKLFRIMVA